MGEKLPRTPEAAVSKVRERAAGPQLTVGSGYTNGTERCEHRIMNSVNGPHEDDERPGVTESERTADKVGSPDDGVNAGTGPDDSSLIEIDGIVDQWSHLRQEAAEERVRTENEIEQFFHEFQHLTISVIRPTMERAIERLRKDGGDGLIEEGNLNVLHRPRVVLWMSMEGEIAAHPRQDLNPFLRFDADAVHRCIDVWEGDMVAREGTSRPTAPLAMSDVTSEAVMERIVEVLRRAGTHGVAP